MARVTLMPRPHGQSEEYRFFKNAETGTTFKAKQALAKNMLDQPMLRLSLSEIGSDGKAVLDENGNVPVYWWTHVFTQDELASPTFDPETALAEALDAAVNDKERDVLSRKRLDEMSAKWKTNEPLAVTKGAK